MTTILQTTVLTSRETKEAIYIQHPERPLEFLFVPKFVVVSKRNVPGRKPGWDVEIEDWWAKEHDL